MATVGASAMPCSASRLEPARAARLNGLRQQNLVVDGEQVECDVARRRLLREQLDPGRGGMDPLRERIEVLGLVEPGSPSITISPSST